MPYISPELEAILTIIGIVNTVISTIACPIIAAHKNRSVGGWIAGGFFLGLIGLIIIACLPPQDTIRIIRKWLATIKSRLEFIKF